MIGSIEPLGANHNLDRQFLAVVVRQCSEQLCKKFEGAEVTSVAFKARLENVLRVKLSDPDFELNWAFFGPILFPGQSERHNTLKFRDFLLEFRDVISVSRTHLGVDVVRPAPTAVSNPKGVSSNFETQLGSLRTELLDLLSRTPIPGPELAKALRDISPELISWLEMVEPANRASSVPPLDSGALSLPSIAGERVEMDVPALTSQELGKSPSPINLANEGCLLVDAANVLGVMTRMFGKKPPSQRLPQWHIVFEYIRERFPSKKSWRGFYYQTVDKDYQSIGLQKLRGYLEKAHFKVVESHVPASGEMMNFEAVLGRRAKMNEENLMRMLEFASSKSDCHVVVVSHSLTLAKPLLDLLKTHDQTKVALLGFPEFMEAPLLELRKAGLQILDLERDIPRVFPTLLPRRATTGSKDPDMLWNS